MKRTAAVELDQDFAYECDLTKAWEDAATGKRFLRGVASGIGEDRDGERCSRRAIAKMAATPLAGGAIKATASHDQDWVNEFGDVIALKHDPDHDELVIDVELPPAGEDPIADKAWKRSQTDRLGWSIGGKLNSAFYELVDGIGKSGRPRQRKVLDDIKLRHVMLTKKPSYTGSFAEAVAKTFTEAAPDVDADGWQHEDDDREDLDAAEILKQARVDLEDAIAKKKGDAQPAKPDDEPDPAAAPVPGQGDVPDEPAAGAGDTDPAPTDEGPTDAEEAKKLPDGEGKRHLSCPNCGHEFAAPLPEDLQDDDAADGDDVDDHPTKEHTTMGKTRMDDALERVRALAAGTGGQPDVAKATPKPDPADGVTVEATDVEKMVAASHLALEEHIEKTATTTGEAIDGLVDVVKTLSEKVAALPLGRRSRATREQGIEKPNGRGDGGTVAKTADEIAKTPLGDLDREDLLQLSDAAIVAKASDHIEAMKAINKRDRGIQ